MPWQGTWLVASWLTGCAFDSDTVVGTTQSWVGANCCILPLPAHVALAHVALVYTVWTLTGVLNSLAHSVMSITTFPQLSFHIATSLVYNISATVFPHRYLSCVQHSASFVNGMLEVAAVVGCR